MAKCYITGKQAQYGNNRSHALNATRKKWNVNIQKVKIKDADGNVKTVKVSARALRKNNLERA